MPQNQQMETQCSQRPTVHQHESGIVYTDLFLKRAGRYYADELADMVSCAQEEVCVLPVQKWVTHAHYTKTGGLHCCDIDENETEIYMATMPSLDRSLDAMQFYFINNTIMMPGEY